MRIIILPRVVVSEGKKTDQEGVLIILPRVAKSLMAFPVL